MSAQDHLNKHQFKTQNEEGAAPTERLSLYDSTGKELSSVKYSHDDGVINVHWLESHQEGKGHATNVMEQLYKNHPYLDVDWGETRHPASRHLAEKFSLKYPNRTSYEEEWK